MKNITKVFKHWRKLIFLLMLIWIVSLNIKVKYLEYLNHKQLSYNSNEYNNDNDEEKENLQQTIDALKSQNRISNEEKENLQQTVDALKSQNKISNKDYKSLFQDIFWDVGKYVPDVDVSDEMKMFYSFGDCSLKVYPNYFTSERYIFYDRDNSFNVYVYSSDIGLVWSPYEITFKTFKEKTKQKH